MANDRDDVTRRRVLRDGLWGACLASVGGVTGGAASRSRTPNMVWQIDPYKCVACGNWLIGKGSSPCRDACRIDRRVQTVRSSCGRKLRFNPLRNGMSNRNRIVFRCAYQTQSTIRLLPGY